MSILLLSKGTMVSMPKEELLDLIRIELGGTINDIKNHDRFDMSGYEGLTGKCTVDNINILNKFAPLGIYNYTTYLFLDFYKGTPTIYLQYFNSEDNLEINELSGLGTCEIIYEIFRLTIFSNNATRRRI